jgi:hypothetical protein
MLTPLFADRSNPAVTPIYSMQRGPEAAVKERVVLRDTTSLAENEVLRKRSISALANGRAGRTGSWQCERWAKITAISLNCHGEREVWSYDPIRFA